METSEHIDDTMVRAIDRVYARALLELAEEKGALEEVATQMADLSSLVNAQPNFRKLLESPSVDSATKQQMLDNIFKGQVHDLIYRFVLVLQRKHRAANLPGIVVAFRQLYHEKHGVVELRAEVARPLDDATRKVVADWVGSRLKRNVNVHETINEDLIGGMKLRVGDYLFDASVATQLRQLRRQLQTAGDTAGRAIAARVVQD